MRVNCANDECDRQVFKQQGLGLCHRCYEVAGVIRHLLQRNILQVGDKEQALKSGLILPKGVKLVKES